MSQKLKHDVTAKETILLRQAVPKYNFTSRKLPKESTSTASFGPDAVLSITPQLAHNAADCKKTTISHTSSIAFSQKSDNKKQKPVAVVGASMQAALTSDTENGKINTVEQKQSSSAPNDCYFLTLRPSVAGNRDPDNIENLNISPGHIPVDPSCSVPLNNMFFKESSTKCNQHSNNALTPVITADQNVADSVIYLQNDTSKLVPNDHCRSVDEQFKQLETERDKLKKDLEVQLQVNSELKRLLIASVGDDLSQRVERLCRDRAQLSLDLGGFSKKMSEEYENLDKVSIQADMWRSKYLASRVMIEELGNARAFYSLQYHDIQDALQQLLNERHELRTNLLEIHRVLHHVKSAFDPLNSQRSSTLRSTNILDLSRSCQQLAEAMKFRLLPAHVAVITDMETDDSLWAGSVTRAEQYAHEVLSRPTEPPGSIKSGSSRLLPLTASPDLPVSRFHPHTRHENLTYNCCATCKGEIAVI